jgi:hypothetical protein
LLFRLSVSACGQSEARLVPTILEGQAVVVITGGDIGFQRVAAESARKSLDGWSVNGKWLEAQPLIGIVR